jgi:transposase
LSLKFVGSVEQKEHPELAAIPRTDPRFVVCLSHALKGTKAFRVTEIVAGSERVLVVTYNPKLAKSQVMTLRADVAKASQSLSELQGRLAGRAAGLIKGGRRPTQASVAQKCRSIVRRQYHKEVIRVTIEEDSKGLAQLTYAIDTDVLSRMAEMHLGKTILISNRAEWSDERIIAAYRSQFLIEAVFKEMKDRITGVGGR